MLTLPDVALILGIAFGAALVAAVLGLGLLRVGRRWPLTRQLWVVVLAPVVSIVAASLVIAAVMFLSTHDLVVTLWIVAAAALVSLAPATVLGRSFMRSTARLTESARRVGAGATVAAGPERTTELAQLSSELAATSSRLADARHEVELADGARRELIAWVSHDLRAPLASARAMAEALDDGLADDAPRYHAGIRAQVDRLSTLVDDLFELSKLQAGALTLQRSPVSVYDLVSDQIADLEPLAAERGIRIDAAGDLTAVIDGDAHQLSRALANLLTNALRHSPAGGTVQVGVRDTGGSTEIAVTDAGGGIRHEDLPRVFEAGWRADESRADASGAGLGLAIVQGIVAAHAGTVEVRNVPGGSRFALLLPSIGTGSVTAS